MKSVLTFLGVFVGVLILIALTLAWGTWLLMLALGILHSIWDSIPALGFWSTLPIAILIECILAWARRSS